MSYSKEGLVNDAKFVVSECARIQILVNQGDLKSIGRLDHMASLPHPGGRGEMLCGAAAAAIITGFAKEAADRGGLSKRVSLANVRKELAYLFVIRFFKEEREIDTKQIDRLFSSTAKACQKYLEDITHFVPCHLMNAKDPCFFNMGPVKFHNRVSMARRVLSTGGLKRSCEKTSE